MPQFSKVPVRPLIGYAPQFQIVTLLMLSQILKVATPWVNWLCSEDVVVPAKPKEVLRAPAGPDKTPDHGTCGDEREDSDRWR
jgi:hypothetical protein